MIKPDRMSALVEPNREFVVHWPRQAKILAVKVLPYKPGEIEFFLLADWSEPYEPRRFVAVEMESPLPGGGLQFVAILEPRGRRPQALFEFKQ